MNPEGKLRIDDETSRVNEESSSGEVSNSVVVTQPAITTTVTTQRRPTSTSAATSSTGTPEMKRSAVKELIERYFYQLQRGCGNPKCSNINCASSGQVATMTPNEIAAKAIQLFSQDAKLCDLNSQQPQQQQPSKVPRTQSDSPTSSHSATSSLASLNNHDTEMLSPNDSSTSSSTSSSGNSTITSGSSSRKSSKSLSSSDSSTTTNSTNTNMSSCATEEILRGVDCGNIDDAPCSTATQNNKASASKPSSSNATATATTKPGTNNSSPPATPALASVDYLNETLLDELLEECKKCNNYDRLLHAINEVCSNVGKLSQSFWRKPNAIAQLTSSATATKLYEMLGKCPTDLKKEDLRALEGENDKDEDSTCTAAMEQDHHEQSNSNTSADSEAALDAAFIATIVGINGDFSDGGSDMGDITEPMEDESDVHVESSNETLVDLESLRRVKKKIFALNDTGIGEALNNNIILLAESIKYGHKHDWEKVIHCLVICFDMATNTSNSFADLEYLERSLPKLCHAARILPAAAQARLSRIWAAHCKDQLQSLIQCCQQLITLQVILDEDGAQENSDVVAVTRVLKIAYYANIMAGELEMPRTHVNNMDTSMSDSMAGADGASDEDDIFFYSQVPKSQYPKFAENKLEKELNVSCMDCRIPLVPFEEFYNEPLSDAISMDRDYLYYKNLSLDPSGEDTHFSFMLYSFILTPATKVIALYYDSRIRMYSERNSSFYSLLSYFGDNSESSSRPDLKLKVRRDNIVDDALIGLELVAMGNPKDLKKQLVVEFVGEQGIDEGGVSKEFFQLIVEEIFNPDFGMFTHQEDTNTVWFNSTSFENEAQFTLIGIILGLAIYNNIILAVNFPMVVYRKLMGSHGSFYDLKDWNPILYRSLKSMLDYEESDMEEVFMQTFKISYTNIFSEVVDHELKPGGGDIKVGQHNKQEFVDLYCDFLLNRSIDRQFKAFKKGFEMVTDESPLKLLFRPEEIELLVCGSRKFDFVELEKSTDYEGGYTKDTQVIIDFWSVVHSMPEESKRKLLEFTTGSDRVPVGGLSRLKLLITRHGPDSNRLPTSHTCFNVLLLPEYSSKEKLEERLLKAINYSKGFGML